MERKEGVRNTAKCFPTRKCCRPRQRGTRSGSRGRGGRNPRCVGIPPIAAGDSKLCISYPYTRLKEEEEESTHEHIRALERLAIVGNLVVGLDGGASRGVSHRGLSVERGEAGKSERSSDLEAADERRVERRPVGAADGGS